MSLRDPFRGYDQWKTTDPWADWEPPPQPRCSKCCAFLTTEPERVTDWADEQTCDGTVKEVEVERSPGVVDIIGEGTDIVTYSHCGIDTKPHAPHTEVLAAGITLHRTCKRCGHHDEESQM